MFKPASIVQKIESAIIRRLVAALAIAGFVPVKVWDGGEYVPARGIEAVLDAVFAVDESTIHFAPAGDLSRWGRLGVAVICGNGNSGLDLISDYHCGDKAFSDAVGAVCDSTETMEVK